MYQGHFPKKNPDDHAEFEKVVRSIANAVGSTFEVIINSNILESILLKLYEDENPKFCITNQDYHAVKYDVTRITHRAYSPTNSNVICSNDIKSGRYELVVQYQNLSQDDLFKLADFYKKIFPECGIITKDFELRFESEGFIKNIVPALKLIQPPITPLPTPTYRLT